MSELDRRTFVKIAVAGCCMAALGDEAFAEEASDAPFDAGPLADYAEPGVYDQYAKAKKLLVVREADRLIALDSICPHKACVVRKNDEGLRCPCHTSQFASDGSYLSGKAGRSLARYAVKLENGRVMVDLKQIFEEADWEKPEASLKIDPA